MQVITIQLRAVRRVLRRLHQDAVLVDDGERDEWIDVLCGIFEPNLLNDNFDPNLVGRKRRRPEQASSLDGTPFGTPVLREQTHTETRGWGARNNTSASAV